MRDANSPEHEGADVEAWEGEGGAVLPEENTPSSKDTWNRSSGGLDTAPQPERSLGGGTMARFYVAALLHYTVERPDEWTAEKEAEYVQSNTTIGQYPLDDVEVTYFEPAESEGGEG
jgi:hypothetical protein